MKTCGFTLLETIIVLAIMTMFFAVSIPLFTKFTENAKLETATRSVVSALRTARVYAIANNIEYYVVFDKQTDPNRHMYFVSQDSINPVEKKDKLPVGVSFGALPGGGATYNAGFKATGEFNTTLPDITITLTHTGGSDTKTITIERTTGRAKIQ